MGDTMGAPAPITLTAENTKDRLKEITDRLEAGIRDIFDSEQYRTYLDTLSKFHNYSFNNCVLIAMQKPDATHIAGYTAWQRNFKRQVMGGEKGIRIIAPTPYRVKREQERIDPASGSPMKGADGRPLTEEVEVKVPAYKVTTVFDISQTEGEPLPEIGVGELAGDVERYSDFFKALERSSPVPIAIEDIQSGAKGYYEQVDKRIAIKEGMGELQTLKTAIHEIAHARLHDIDANAPKDTPRPDHDTREVEAESVAYTVCARYGLDTSDYSFGYIAGWSADRELDTLRQSLETIRTEAGAIITEVDAHMAGIAREREVMAGLHTEVEATLRFFVDRDMKDTGKLSESTIEAIRVQGFAMQDGKLVLAAAAASPPEKVNPLKTAEMSTEQNLNMIDGALNNTPATPGPGARQPGDPILLSDLIKVVQAERRTTGQGEKRKGAETRPSIREQLRQGREQVARERSAPERTRAPHGHDRSERS